MHRPGTSLGGWGKARSAGCDYPRSGRFGCWDSHFNDLMAMKIVGGMSTEEHHEFDIGQTPAIFEKQGFEVEQMQSCQLGLNRLFVFRKP
jgi:hypothetical protein